MNPAQFRKTLRSYDLWVPVGFSAFLGFMVVVLHISSGLRLGAQPTAADSWVPVFFAFLPMTFFYASASHRQTRERIKVLEARVEQLEADKGVAS